MMSLARRWLSVSLLLTPLGCGRAVEVDPSRPPPRSERVEATPAAREAGSAPEPTDATDEYGLGEAPAEDPQFRATVVLVPLRGFPDDLSDAVEQALRAELDVEVERHAVVELPDEAWYAPRKRYRADALLDFLEQYADDDETKVLGLTEVDISTTSDPYPDWGIFGLGRSPGATAVISSFRLQRKPKNREHVLRRVATVAVHEIGHTFGLPHCAETSAECVMLDAEGGIENTDTSSGSFGPSCRALLEQLAPL